MINNFINPNFKWVAPLFLVLLGFTFQACEEDNDSSNNNEPDVSKNEVGASAKGLLDKDQYERLVVEVKFGSGYSPKQQSLNNMKNFLDQHLKKPEGIKVMESEASGLSENTYTVEEIRNIEEDARTQSTNGNTITIFLLFLDGKREEDNSNQTTLGIAYYNTSAAIFGKTIRELSGGIGEPSREKVETAVINHELGHLLGLVNNGTPMQADHQDDENGAHCDVEDCLMYYAVETGDVVSNLAGSDVPTLDQQCKDDLKANGGK